MLIIFAMFGIPGNTVVVLVYYREKRLSATKLIILIIATVDLFSSLIVIPCNAVNGFYWLEISNVYFCKFRWTINAAVCVPEMFLIAGTAVVRYCHVCKPNKLHIMESTIKPFCACCLLIGLIISVIMATCMGCPKWQHINEYTPGFSCKPSDECIMKTFYKIVFYSLISSYAICIFIIITLNLFILRRIFKQQKIMERYKIAKRKRRKSKKINADMNTNRSRKMSGSLASSYKDVNREASTTSTTLLDLQSTSTKHEIGSKFSSVYDIREAKNTDTCSKLNLDFENSKSIEYHRLSYVSKSNEMNNEKENTSRKVSSTQKKKFSIVDVKSGTNIERGKARGSFYHTFIALLHIETWNRVTLKLFVVSYVYIVSYMPYFIIAARINFYKGDALTLDTPHVAVKYLLKPALYLIFLGPALNPLIYTFIDPKFRAQCEAIFKYKYKL